MGRRNPSIEDIAREAGVANSTVSRALRNSRLISTDVREQIQRIAREMGYTPNSIAQSLQNQRSHTIGLAVTTIADPFFADVAKGVEEGAQAAGFSVFLSASYRDPVREIAVLETFQRRRVDAIIVADSRISMHHAERLVHADVPTVLINSQAEEQSQFLHSVAVDDYQGARQAVEYLIQLGHRKIGYLGSSTRPKSNHHRLAGYRDALLAAGVEPSALWSVAAPEEDVTLKDDVAVGQALVAPLLAEHITALFCYNDMTAVGVLMTCRERGIAVPEALSVIGFDDIATAQYVTPALTTVQQPKMQLGSVAFQMLLDLLEHRPVQNHVIPPKLVQRASTAPKPPEGATTK